MLVLGCDRDNETVQHIYDERNLAVRRAIRHLIEVAHKDGKTVSICGQAPSVYPELCEFLVKSGIDSISVTQMRLKILRKWWLNRATHDDGCTYRSWSPRCRMTLNGNKDYTFI